jgi:hypothetical protein
VTLGCTSKFRMLLLNLYLVFMWAMRYANRYQHGLRF